MLYAYLLGAHASLKILIKNRMYIQSKELPPLPKSVIVGILSFEFSFAYRHYECCEYVKIRGEKEVDKNEE
jgi:hypothetical protein